MTDPTPPLPNFKAQTRTVPVADLKPAPYNPRRALLPTDAEYRKIKQSLDAFGYVQLIVWNQRSGHIVGGHQRLTVMVNEWAVTELSVSVVDLDEEQEKTLNVALNKIDGVWDEDQLSDLLIELQQSETADAQVTGFEGEELERLLQLHELEPEPELDTSPQLEDLDFKVIVSCRDEDHQRELLERLQDEGETVSAQTT